MNYMQSDNGSSRDVLAKRATQGAFALGGGVALLILNNIAHIPVVGFIVGGAMLLGGLATMRNKSGSSAGKSESRTGLGLVGLGALTAASSLPILGGLASSLMWISGLGLVGFGAYKLYKFYQGYKSKAS